MEDHNWKTTVLAADLFSSTKESAETGSHNGRVASGRATIAPRISRGVLLNWFGALPVPGPGMTSEERNSDRAKKYISRLDQFSESASFNPR